MNQDLFQKNLEAVRRRIESACQRCGRSPSEVLLLPVTKTHSVETIRALAGVMGLGPSDAAGQGSFGVAGQGPFGENYVQELAGKAEQYPEARWHFIGHLQRNKVKMLPETCVMIQTIDSERLLETIERRFPSPIECLIEVHLTAEETKSGILPEDLPDLLRAASAYTKPRITGLMTMAAYGSTPDEARPTFKKLRGLRDQMNAELDLGTPLVHLSMGMSSDFEAAIEEGATLIRVGTALFGERE